MNVISYLQQTILYIILYGYTTSDYRINIA